MATVELAAGAPLTVLSGDEQMFRDLVRQFADDEVRPRVNAMDEAQKMDPALISQFFELGLMGIEVPEELGGAGASFFTAALVVEELSRVDASVGVFVDVQNTLVNNAFLRWGSEELKAKYLPALAAEKVGAYALSEAGSGSDAFALATRAVKADGGYRLTGRKLWITNGGEAGIFIVFANVDPAQGYKGITGVHRGEGVRRLQRGEEGGQARHPRLVHHRADPGGRVRARRERAGRGGQGLQDGDRDAERGPYRHRRADDRHRRRARWTPPSSTRRSASSSASAIGDFQGVQFQIAQMAMELEAARLMVYNAARLKDAGHPFLKEAAMAKLFASRWRSASRPRPSTCSAATASPASTRWRSSTATARSARSTRAPATCSCRPSPGT